MGIPPSGLRTFLSELRRRRVLRVAAVYLVVAWAVIEVADTIVPNLGLPDWIVTAIIVLAGLCLPVALVLGWAFEVTPEGVRRAEQAPAVAPGSWRLTSRHSAWLAIGLIIIAFAGGWAIVGGRTPTGNAAAAANALDPSAVAVFPFQVVGGPSVDYLREGMMHLMGTKLDGAGALRRVDPQMLLPAYAGSVHAEPVAAARSLGAGLVVRGTVVEAGRQLQLAASLHDLTDGSVVRAAAAATHDGLLEAVDRLAAALLAEHARTPARRLTRIAALTTDSLRALRHYLEGEERFRAGLFTEAIEAFQRAVEVDTAFALGHYRLAVAAEWSNHEFALGRIASSAALRHATRLSPQDRTLLRALRAWQRAEPDEAERLYREALGFEPNNVEAWYWLGEVFIHFNPLRGRSALEARQPFERVLALDPRSSFRHTFALFHLMEVAMREGRSAAVDSLARAFVDALDTEPFNVLVRAVRDAGAGGGKGVEAAAEAIRTTSIPNVATSVVLLSLFSSHLATDDLTRLLEALADEVHLEETRATAHVLLSGLALERGRVGAALAHIRRARSADAATGLEALAFVAALPFLPGSAIDREGAIHALEMWDAAPAPPMAPEWTLSAAHWEWREEIRSLLLALLQVESGDVEAALRVAERLGAGDGDPRRDRLRRSFSGMIRARALFGAGRHEDAIATLDRAPLAGDYPWLMISPLLSHALDRYLRAEALLARGELEEAAAWFAAAGEIVSPVDRVLIAPSHLRRGEIYERLGNRERAAEHYSRFVELWRDADPELQPRVEDVRRRLARLAGAGAE